jgi:hypothetical protein
VLRREADPQRLFSVPIWPCMSITLTHFPRLYSKKFYAVIATIILGQLGFDPLALFLSMSGVILAFGFIIGTATAKYFEGLLFILIRRPYGIGDPIHISNVQTETSFYFSAPWVSHNFLIRLIFWQCRDELHSNLCPPVASLSLLKISPYSRRLLFGDQPRRDAVCRTAPWPTVAS